VIICGYLWGARYVAAGAQLGYRALLVEQETTLVVQEGTISSEAKLMGLKTGKRMTQK